MNDESKKQSWFLIPGDIAPNQLQS